VTVARNWSIHQLVEFLAGVSGSANVEAATSGAVERAAEALEAELGAIVAGGRVITSVGFRGGRPTEAQLAALSEASDNAAAQLPDLGTCRVVAAPLEGEPPARLLLGRLGDEPFNTEDVNLLRGMARVLSMTLHSLRLFERERDLRKRSERQAAENTRLIESLEARRRLHEQLTRIERTISHRARLQEVLDSIVEGAAELLREDLAALRLVDANDPSWIVTAAITGPGPAESSPRRAPATHGLSGRAISRGRLEVFEGADAREVLLPDLLGRDAHSAVAVPVHEHGTVVGALVVASRSADRRFSDSEREMLTAFAEHASLALAAAKTVDSMRQAFNDALTGLPNRTVFVERLTRALGRSRAGAEPVTVLFIDLDRFKLVNDSLGHVEGDKLLVEVSRRLRASLRHGETAARLGGDEFAVLLDGPLDTRNPGRVAKRILDALREPIRLQDRDVFTGASIGIASASSGSAEELLRNADVAMYRAKARGKGRYEVFEPGMHAEVVARLELEADLQRAMERGDFVLHYQPIVDLATGTVVGVEALVRMTHPQRGLVPPGEFIPLAEETGLILPLSRFVLREACRQVAAWQSTLPSPTPLNLSVNLSGRQLESSSIATEVANVIGSTKLDPSSVMLEITETVLMHDTREIVERLHELRGLGVRLAIDDFGTGYSSLNYLQRLPIDVLKIARPFVDGLGSGAREGAVARAIVDLARALELETVAEGIECEDQAMRLGELGCRLGQGFHFARPMEAVGVERLLRSQGELAPIA
jgi:diguanylate cyclase (GGDEF)-like protein